VSHSQDRTKFSVNEDTQTEQIVTTQQVPGKPIENEPRGGGRKTGFGIDPPLVAMDNSGAPVPAEGSNMAGLAGGIELIPCGSDSGRIPKLCERSAAGTPIWGGAEACPGALL
jgi:hypothetical protein